MKTKLIIAALFGMILQLCSCSSDSDLFSKLSDADKEKLTHEGYTWGDDLTILDMTNSDKVRDLEIEGIKLFIQDAKDVSNIKASNMRRVESPFPADILIEDYVNAQGETGEVIYFCDDDGTALGTTFNKSSLESLIESEQFKTMLGDTYDALTEEGRKIMFLLLNVHLGQIPFVESAETVTIDGKPHRVIGVLSKD